MSGLEPLVAIAAPKVLTAAAKSILSKLVSKVARHFTLRLRVYLRVRKSTKLHPPARIYLKWLREAAKSELQTPLEEAGPGLAVTLSKALDGDWKWRRHDDRRSKALRLVEETYLAMLTLIPESDARVLEEHWERHRHETLLAALSSTGRLTGFSRVDVATMLLRESHNRRMARLRSFGLTEDQVAGLVDLMAGVYPDVSAGSVVTLVGPFGAGKSEQAESWFVQAAASYRDTDGASQPMWFHASMLTSMALDEAVRERLREDTTDLNVAIVIDGLDEVDPDVASRVAEQARVFIATHSASRAVMTVRPGALPEDDKDTFCRGLNDDEVEAIVDLVAGNPVHTGHWNTELRESVRRPFFAIAVGRAHRDGVSLHGQAGVIRHLVERALEDPATKLSAVQQNEVYQLLEHLAVHLTESGSRDDGLSYARRQQTLRSRLVREVNGHAEFTLPIFQQWFAAQALLTDPERINGIAADPLRFGRWRWALAVAGSAAKATQLDDLLQRCIHSNPGAGAWVQTETTSGQRAWSDREKSAPEPAEAKSRLLLAARTWVDGFGQLAPNIYPIQTASTPITLGVGVHGSSVSLGWSYEVADRDRALDLPNEAELFMQSEGPWIPDLLTFIATGDRWPWSVMLERAKSHLHDVFRDKVPEPFDGVWLDERRYQLIRELTGTKSMLFPPVNRDRARDAVAVILDQVPDPANTTIMLHRSAAQGSDLLALQNWLQTCPDEEITRPLATPDIMEPPNRWVWSVYSPAQLELFTVEMLGRACEAYDEAATAWFPRFNWTLGTGAPGQFGVLSEITYSGRGQNDTPGMHTMVVPLSVVKDEVKRQDVPFVESFNGRAAIVTTGNRPSRDQGYLYDRAKEWWRNRTPIVDSSRPFGQLSYSTSILDAVRLERPSSGVAVGWLWSDLTKLGIVSGRAPDLR